MAAAFHSLLNSEPPTPARVRAFRVVTRARLQGVSNDLSPAALQRAQLLAEIAAQQLSASKGMLPLESSATHLRVFWEATATQAELICYVEARSLSSNSCESMALLALSAALIRLRESLGASAASIADTRTLFVEVQGESLWCHPDGLSAIEGEQFAPRAPAALRGYRAAAIVLSDRAARGQYADRSGPLLVDALHALHAECAAAQVIADEPEALLATLRRLPEQSVQLCLLSGGTGLGPRDITPETLRMLGGRDVPGLAELFRQATSVYTPLSWLSRASVLQWNGMLLIALPGHPRAVRQALDVLTPLLPHALAMIEGGRHP